MLGRISFYIETSTAKGESYQTQTDNTKPGLLLVEPNLQHREGNGSPTQKYVGDLVSYRLRNSQP